jgi:hypothetical protein
MRRAILVILSLVLTAAAAGCSVGQIGKVGRAVDDVNAVGKAVSDFAGSPAGELLPPGVRLGLEIVGGLALGGVIAWRKIGPVLSARAAKKNGAVA